MKRLTCLALILVMVLSMFLVGCGKSTGDPEDTVTEEKERNSLTLKFYIITEDVTTEDAKEAMQDAFNAVCRAKYSTQVEFVFSTADEYKAKLDQALELADTAIGEEDEKLPSAVYDKYDVVTELDEFNLPYLIYNDALENQIDIILINSKEMLDEYIEKDYVLDITSNINGENKAIKEYINSSLLANTKIKNKWYAVPNNTVVGDYKYLLINKELASNYYLVESDFTKLDDEGNTVVNYAACLDFAKSLAEDALENVAPIYARFPFPTTEFWSEDGTPFALATFYNATTGLGDYVRVSNTFENQTYIDYLKFDLEASENNYYAENTTSVEKFGIKVVDGDYSSRFNYEKENYVIVLDNPRVFSSDGFASMFAVSKFTASASRSMEIIQDLMTDSQLCNILLYGVEGTDYYFDEDNQTVTRVGSDYRMNMIYTGNVFKTYPCINEGMRADHWTYGMYQNQEAASVPLDGCPSSDLWNTVRNDIIREQMLFMAKQEVIDVVGETIDSPALNDYKLRLQQFYSGIDPNAEPETTPTGDPIVTEITLDARSKVQLLFEGGEEKDGFRQIAEKIADDTISAIFEKSEEYFARISECKTAEEIDLAVEEILADMKASPLFYNERSTAWKDAVVTVTHPNGEEVSYTAPFGMLLQLYRDEPVMSSLAGALLAWYRGLN